MNNNKKVLFSAGVTTLACSFLLVGCNSANVGQGLLNQALNPASSAVPPQAAAGGSTGSTEAVTYKNKDRNFSFVIPAGWSKQSGDVNSDTVLFMQEPLTKTCSFQFNMTRMQTDFPAEASVKASLDSAKKDIKIDKNLSAKRRDESGMEKGKKVRFTRGWELTEKGQAGGHQRIIYQAYDRQNYYINMMAAAETEHFEECRPALQQIVTSIKFGD
ncbi:MAG: hypothetical protein Q8L79_14060 [Methylobacter sp.]|uniref:hypothetical protein n=1 Tax=Methylobacter sp. TaxID=2051955 RepID=UPI002731795B|nr:hypothetical protein [Methylobacter sp.]MDP1666232.1 hypothetical protein [Methylobacter sp.]MDP1970251.1 hypothetical protein [Methylobacter sp.]